MSHSCLCRALSPVIIITALCSAPSQGATPAEIDKAIEKAQKFLLDQQKAGGHWENDEKRTGTDHNWGKMQGDSFGGFTAIATYSLIASGASLNDPKIVAAVDFLKKADVIGIYALGLRCQVWLLLPSTSAANTRLLAQEDARKILFGVNMKGFNQGCWDYGNGKGGRLDHSVSQYGILGLWAAEQTGAEVPKQYWDGFDKVWRAHQFPDGGWQYDGTPQQPSKEHKENASMTAAGVATLFITQDFSRPDVGLNCSGNIINENIEKGLAWMGKNFDQVNDMYTWYGVERIGVASGYKYFGTIDWFATGADKVLKRQRPDGSFDGGFVGGTPIPSTAYGLLFLARGRAPVMMNKLDYTKAGGKPAKWNQRPRDVANLARWTTQTIEADLNWQIVNLQVSADDLHDAPILYITGNEPLDLSEEDVKKLREFVEDGGLILGNADCDNAGFSSSFRKLGTTLFPKYEFRELPAGHPILSNELFKKIKSTKLEGLTNGTRELMLLIPNGDPSKWWQSHASTGRVESFQIGSDIFLYAVDKKGLHNKGVTYIVHANPKVSTSRTVKLARLEASENWDPEPGGWRRLGAILHNDPYKVDLKVEPVKLGEGKLADYKVAHLTGTAAFKLTDSQVKQLTEFVSKGGTLIMDAAGGSNTFADAAEAAIQQLFGADANAGLANPLDPGHALYQVPGAKLDAYGYRDFARKTLVGGVKIPRIRGIEQKGRIVAFYSREDLSTGMVGEPVDGIYGYDPDTATAIMRNLILYSAFGNKGAH